MKISTKIRKDVIDKLTKKIDAACLRRDVFLERVLEIEIPALDREVAIPNTDEARAFVAKKFVNLGKDNYKIKPVSFSLRDDLVKQLDEICARKNIVRDAFFNRVLFLLAASPKVIDHLFFEDRNDWRTEVWSECKHDGPFFNNVFYPLEPEIDPFRPIRTGLEMELETSKFKLVDFKVPETGEVAKVEMGLTGRPHLPESLYTITFLEEELLELNTYLPEWEIPGHREQIGYQKELDEFLNELFGLEGTKK